MAARRSISAHESRIAAWLNGVAATLFWVDFAIRLDWWQMATAIFFTFSAVLWAIKTKRIATT